MNIFDYVDKYKDYTFLDKGFNEVDNVIFSTLAYVDYNFIVSTNKLNKITLQEASEKCISMYSKKKTIMATREAMKLLKKVKDTKRFKDILMYSYRYIGNEESQFSAITFEISKDLCYVAFEGTDQLISGWKEDCKMAYQFPVDAHRYAIKYLNHNFLFSTKKIIVGGHSKGGNLALVSSMYCNYFVNKKIVNVYSNDGQGLRKAQIDSKKYENIKGRLIHIIPQYSIVGLLLRHDDNYTVIHATKKGLVAHCTSFWKVSDDAFVRDKLSKFSKILDEGGAKWLNEYDDEKRELFVNSVFSVLEENNVKSIVQLKNELKLVFSVLKSSKKLDPIVKEMLKDLIKIINSTNKEYLWIK